MSIHAKHLEDLRKSFINNLPVPKGGFSDQPAAPSSLLTSLRTSAKRPSKEHRADVQWRPQWTNSALCPSLKL